VPVTVCCRECLNENGSTRLCTEFGDIINNSGNCVYLYENVDSLEGSSFVPQLATVMDEICEDGNHSRPRVMEVSGDVTMASCREGVKRQILRQIRKNGTIGKVATF
jgi:hypothetical protein